MDGPLASRAAVVLIVNSVALERIRIVSKHRRSHIEGDRDLPGVVLDHSPGRARLELRYLSRINPMYALPGITPQVGFNGFRVFSTFEHLGESHGCDPESGCGITL